MCHIRTLEGMPNVLSWYGHGSQIDKTKQPHTFGSTSFEGIEEASKCNKNKEDTWRLISRKMQWTNTSFKLQAA